MLAWITNSLSTKKVEKTLEEFKLKRNCVSDAELRMETSVVQLTVSPSKHPWAYLHRGPGPYNLLQIMAVPQPLCAVYDLGLCELGHL